MAFTEILPQANAVRGRAAHRALPVLAVLGTVLFFAGVPQAAADNDWVAARGEIACKWMDMHPNLYGGLSTMRTMEDEGVARPDVPSVLAEVIATHCPGRADVFRQVKDYLTHMGNPGIIGAG